MTLLGRAPMVSLRLSKSEVSPPTGRVTVKARDSSSREDGKALRTECPCQNIGTTSHRVDPRAQLSRKVCRRASMISEDSEGGRPVERQVKPLPHLVPHEITTPLSKGRPHSTSSAGRPQLILRQAIQSLALDDLVVRLPTNPACQVRSLSGLQTLEYLIDYHFEAITNNCGGAGSPWEAPSMWRSLMLLAEGFSGTCLAELYAGCHWRLTEKDISPCCTLRI